MRYLPGFSTEGINKYYQQAPLKLYRHLIFHQASTHWPQHLSWVLPVQILYYSGAGQMDSSNCAITLTLIHWHSSARGSFPFYLVYLISTRSMMSIQWVIIAYSHCFNTQVFLGLVNGSAFKLNSFHMTYPQYSSLFLFLVQHDVLESFCNSPTQDLESAISPRSPGSFPCRNGF